MLTVNAEITEQIEDNYITYTLNAAKSFDEVGFKVMRSQEESIVLKCGKGQKNGKTRLVFDVSEYISLKDYIIGASVESVRNVIASMLSAMKKILNNGFIEPDNIFMTTDKIFVRREDESACFLFLPQKTIHTKACFDNELHRCIIQTLNMCGDKSNAEKMISLLSDKHFSLPVELDAAAEALRKLVFDNAPSSYGGDAHAKEEKLIGKLFSSIKIKKSDLPDYSDNIRPSYNACTSAAYEIMILNGSFEGREIDIKIESQKMVLGHNPRKVDYCISFNPAISGVHCEIINNGGVFTVRDLNSKNGTYINGGARIEPQKEYPLKSGDVLRLANFELRVMTRQAKGEQIYG